MCIFAACAARQGDRLKNALYRKYRPVGFDGIIGQDVIVSTLIHQIERGTLSHAYLFTGSRGTGKTSCAKILARAVNCLSPVNGSPCGKCEVCRALASPSNIDIVEMDAASNNGVDKIRELRENVDYMPSVGKYKVYIIDEVHMLSVSAFNALLKTLEEPPEHVIFVLCTTEVHKLPATILSRCMRFDFRLVPEDKLCALVTDIFAKEGVKAEKEAIAHIARLGEGSVRDTLSVADRCMNAADGVLTYSLVLDITGSGSAEDTETLMSGIIDANAAAVVRKTEELASRGKSPLQISRELTVLSRDLILIISGASEDVAASPEGMTRLRALASRTNVPFLVRLVKALGEADAELRYSSSPRITLECALLSLCISPSPTHSGESSPGRAALAAEGGKEQAAPGSAAPTVRREDMRAVTILGRLRHALRARGELRLFGEYASLPDDCAAVRGDTFTVYVPASSVAAYAEERNMRVAQECLTGICGLRLEVGEMPPSTQSRVDVLVSAARGLETEVVDGKGRKLRR